MSLLKKKKKWTESCKSVLFARFLKLFARLFLSRLPHNLRAWKRLRKLQLAGQLSWVLWVYKIKPTFFKLASKFSLLFILAGHSLTYMKSVFRNCQQDRLWKFDCGFNEASKEFCHWSHGYANDAKDGIFFDCPNNGFISGKAFNHA